MFDLLIVGAGLFGSTIAYKALEAGMEVLVLEKRNHIGGNCYTRNVEGINVHEYGAHIFRTNNEEVWRFMNRFSEFNNFINSPIANYHGELYNLPFNMNTFHQLWGVQAPEEAMQKIEENRVRFNAPQNLEEHVLNSAGRDIYQKLVKGYTEKQWGKACSDLPASIMRRIPLRFTFDNNYFNARFQGIPVGGYTHIFEQLLEGAEVLLETDYLLDKETWNSKAHRVVYSGPIDSYFDYAYGPLEYRSLRFEHEHINCSNYQGVAVMNFTDYETPYTRIIEHKHFEFLNSPTTIITREYPKAWVSGEDPYYPMEDEKNRERFNSYAKLATAEEKVRFGGRLGEYKYFDMQDTVLSALNKYETWFTGDLP